MAVIGLALKKKKVKRRFKSTLVSVFCVVLITVILGTVSKTWLSIYEKEKEKETLSKNLNSLRKEETQLVTDVAKLKDPEYVARFLREKYFYSTNGEYIIRLPE